MTTKNIQSFFGSTARQLQAQFIGAEFNFPPNTTGLGSEWVPKEGQELNRITHAALWDWVQNTQGAQLVDDATWFSIQASSPNGAVSVYSTGDGTTTFRVPSVGTEGGFARTAGTAVTDPVLLNVGFDDQIQNITGDFQLRTTPGSSTIASTNGAFKNDRRAGGTWSTIDISGNSGSDYNEIVDFDASEVARTGDETYPKGYYVKVFIYSGSDVSLGTTDSGEAKLTDESQDIVSNSYGFSGNHRVEYNSNSDSIDFIFE